MPALLRIRDLHRFARQMAKRYDLEIATPEFSTARGMGGRGLHITRRRGPPTVLKSIKLVIELQYKWAEQFYCYGWVVDGIAYATRTDTIVCENGTYTITYSAEGGMHLFSPTDPYEDCPTITEDSTAEEGFDYGPIEDTTIAYSDALSASALITAAEAAAEDSGDPYVNTTIEYLSNEEPPTVLDVSLGYVHANNAHSATVRRFYYRWRNEGEVAMDISWDASGTTHTLTLDPGEESSWYADDPGPDFAGRDKMTDFEFTIVE